MLAAVAGHPNVKPTTLWAVVNNVGTGRCAVLAAKNPHADGRVLDFLAHNTTLPAVYVHVGSHGNAWPETLRFLATHKNSVRVAKALSANPRTPGVVLDFLAHYGDVACRDFIKDNPNVSAETRAYIVQSSVNIF